MDPACQYVVYSVNFSGLNNVGWVGRSAMGWKVLIKGIKD
jgi:hypothetical protein